MQFIYYHLITFFLTFFCKKLILVFEKVLLLQRLNR